MTKKEMIDSLAKKLGDKVQAERAFDGVFGCIIDALKAGDSIAIPNFGTFKVVERAARKGRNPRTGEEMQISASKTVKFTPGKGLKEAVAGK